MSERLDHAGNTPAQHERVRLSAGLTSNALTRPVIEGVVSAEGLTLITSAVNPAELFWRQLHFGDFDASEMSMSSLFIATSRGDRTWWALPVFTTRMFFHTRILVRKGAGIKSPGDLRGRRVGVPEYQQTAAVWSRAVLAHEFNVQPGDIEWFMERLPGHSHGSATGSKPPRGVTINQIPPDSSIADMLVRGTLDAALFYIGARTLLDRSELDLSSGNIAVPLFENPAAEGARYFSKSGFFPLNHGMVVRRSLVEKYPWLPLNLYFAMLKAKQHVDMQTQAALAPYFSTGLLPAKLSGALAQDVMPYGLRANRSQLEYIAKILHEQGLTDRLVALEEVFAPTLFDI